MRWIESFIPCGHVIGDVTRNTSSRLIITGRVIRNTKTVSYGLWLIVIHIIIVGVKESCEGHISAILKLVDCFSIFSKFRYHAFIQLWIRHCWRSSRFIASTIDQFNSICWNSEDVDICGEILQRETSRGSH